MLIGWEIGPFHVPAGQGQAYGSVANEKIKKDEEEKFKKQLKELKVNNLS